MRKLKYILVIVVITIISCDPIYMCYINNNLNNSIIIKTYPAVENYFVEGYLDEHNVIRLNSSDSLSIYKIQDKSVIMFFSSFGFYPAEKVFPFEYLEIISQKDTLFFRSKIEIINGLNKIKGKRKFDLNID